MSALLQGDALIILRTLKSESVHMVVTSPPYFNLRSYLKSDDPMKKLEIGLEKTPEEYVENLVQIFREVKRVLRPEGTAWLNIGDSFAGSNQGKMADGSQVAGPKQKTNVGSTVGLKGILSKEIGLKPKDLIGIPWMVAKDLQADGWWLRSDIIWAKGCSFGPYVGNPMPESVSGSSWSRHRIKIAKSERAKSESSHSLSQEGINTPQGARDGADFKDHGNEYIDCPGCPKCSPNDGYILSWNAGRPSRAHEYIFLLTKSEKYFFDSQAVRENFVDKRMGNPGKYKWKQGKAGIAGGGPNSLNKGDGIVEGWNQDGKISGRNIRSVWTIPNELENLFWEWHNSQEEKFTDVWTISTRGYREAHFATFPISLIEPIIKAGSSEKGCCQNCGMPWVRVIKKGFTEHDGETKSIYQEGATANRLALLRQAARERGEEYTNKTETIGWKSTCQCNAGDPVPCTILDIFGGAGTSGVVATELGRKFILIELNPDYVEMSKKRIAEAAMKKLEG